MNASFAAVLKIRAPLSTSLHRELQNWSAGHRGSARHIPSGKI
jgi:hypothetical protein